VKVPNDYQVPCRRSWEIDQQKIVPSQKGTAATKTFKQRSENEQSSGYLVKIVLINVLQAEQLPNYQH